MLPSPYRMRRGTEFVAAVRRGRRAGQSVVVVHLLRGDGTGPPRVGFVAAKSVGGAVVRNRVLRRLRHLMRERLGALPPGSLVVVRARPAAAHRAAADLATDLDTALDRVLRRRKGATR